MTVRTYCCLKMRLGALACGILFFLKPQEIDRLLVGPEFDEHTPRSARVSTMHSRALSCLLFPKVALLSLKSGRIGGSMVVHTYYDIQ